MTIVVETELTGITGLRLEVLPDSRLPSKGPGRAADGNFVLNELELTAAPKADPKQAKPVKLEKALADFSQDDLDVAKAIDGSAERSGQRLGRLSGHRESTHWATFETARADRQRRRDGADLQAAPQVRRRLDARPVPALGHPRRQAGRPEPAGGLPRHPGRRARGADRGPEERCCWPTSAPSTPSCGTRSTR